MASKNKPAADDHRPLFELENIHSIAEDNEEEGAQ